jgi:diguanylate cyclase (GGDEF)-like protein
MLVVLLVYIFLVLHYYPGISVAVGVFAVLPVVGAGLLYGMRGGLLAALLITAVGIPLYNLIEPGHLQVIPITMADLVGILILFGAGGLVGRLRDLAVGMQRELMQRQEAEAALEANEARLQRLAAELSHQAHHDSLTRLPNRLLFEDRLQQALAHAARMQTLVAVCFLDVDRLKLINDTYGHAVGDSLLQQVGERLSQSLRTGDTVSRIGGDEYALVLPHLKEPAHAVRLAGKIMALFEAPFNCLGQMLDVTVSMGLSLYPTDGGSVQLLLKRADNALYQAKRQGKNAFHLFQEEMEQASMQRLTLEHDLRGAFERGELELHYQPQIEGDSRVVVVVEALARWRHPQLGLVPPDTFIPIAEEGGLIAPIGNWILETACRQTRAWRDGGHPLLRLAVNVSAAQFLRADFVDTVLGALERAGLPPPALELELAEGLFMHHNPDSQRKLQRLRDGGVTVAIDAFGTGYSSLQYLQQLAVDTLKIDRSFTHGIREGGESPERAIAIIHAITTLAHSLNLRVVAEGIDTPDQLFAVRRVGADRVQGHLISRPIPAADMTAYLAQNSSLAPPGKPVAG